MLNYECFSKKFLIATILPVLLLCILLCGYVWGYGDKMLKPETNTTCNQLYASTLAIQKIIDSYSDRSKLYLFHFGSMACKPCLEKVELFKQTKYHSDQYQQVILILLDDDKKEFEERFNLSEHKIDVFTYKEKGLTMEILKTIGVSDGIPCSRLYDGRGGYITSDTALINRIIFGYKLGCMVTTLKYNPNNYNAHMEWGMRLLSLSRHDDAIAEFELCKQIKPDDPNASVQLSSLYFQVGKYEKVLEEIELIISITSGETRTSLEVLKKEVDRIKESIKEQR